MLILTYEIKLESLINFGNDYTEKKKKKKKEIEKKEDKKDMLN